MKKNIIILLFVCMFCLAPLENCYADTKTYFLENPFPNRIKQINSNDGFGVYIVEKMGIKTWYGHLIVPDSNKYIPANEILDWNEILPKQKIKGWLYINTKNKKVHISVVIKDNNNNTYKPYSGNGIYNLE